MRACTKVDRRQRHSSGAIVLDSQSPPGRFSFAILTTGIDAPAMFDFEVLPVAVFLQFESCQSSATSIGSPSMTAMRSLRPGTLLAQPRNFKVSGKAIDLAGNWG